MRVVPYGERAFYIDLEPGDDEGIARARRTHAVAAYLRERLPHADVVVGAGAVVIAGLGPWDEIDAVVVEAVRAPIASAGTGRLHKVRAVYDGPDLDEVAARAGIDRAQVARLHAGREYLVELAGFLPGFAYLGEVDPALQTPRRSAPRKRVDALSIGIAGAHTGIYPSVSPGGWNLIGRAVDVALFDPARTPPALFAPGDRVVFTVEDVA